MAEADGTAGVSNDRADAGHYLSAIESDLAAVQRLLEFIVSFAVAVLLLALGQTTPDDAPQNVLISGRVMMPGGAPASVSVRMVRIGGTDEKRAMTDSYGVFTFFGASARSYMISLGPGYKTPPKTIDTADRNSVQVADMILQSAGDLKLEQILVDAQESVGGELKPLATPPMNCSGGKVKTIRVVRFSSSPKLTRIQIQEEVQKVWLSNINGWSSLQYPLV